MENLAQLLLASHRTVPSRRGVALVAAAAVFVPGTLPSHAIETDPLDDLPKQTASAYKMQWPSLQIAADYYVFELLDLVENPTRWNQIAELSSSTNIGSAASVSKVEREFFTPMRILSLAFPPDLGGDEMQEAFNSFQKVIAKMTRQARSAQVFGDPEAVLASAGKDIKELQNTWEEGRESLNSFFVAMNTATSTTRMVTIPKGGKNYPRSKKLYSQLMRDAALCRNRGGETLAAIWGQLMVYADAGVNPCGNINFKNYFELQVSS